MIARSVRVGLGVVAVLACAAACGELIGAAGEESPPADASASDVLPSRGCPARCLPPAPSGWTGPSAVFDDVLAPGASPPPCAAPYSVVDVTAGRDVDAGPASCGCGAGTNAGATCSYQLVSWNGANCTGTVTQNALVTVGHIGGVGCFGVGGPQYKLSQIEQDAGTCVFASPSLPDAGFARATVACAPAAPLAACGDRPDCVATLPPAPGFARTCIHHDGDVACPSADYALRFVAYRGLDDRRTCTPCTGVPSVGCGSTFGTTNNGCSAPSGSAAVGSCASGTGVNLILTDLVDAGGCGATGGGSVTGEAAPADAVTFCCSD